MVRVISSTEAFKSRFFAASCAKNQRVRKKLAIWQNDDKVTYPTKSS
jgi:hypothetical protein